MFILLKVVFQMIISYIFALISFSLIVSVAPIFIAFALFDRTKNYFRMWYQQLFYFALQPTLMFMTTLFFFSIINNFLTNVMSFKVCKTIYPLVINGGTILSFMDYKASGLSIYQLVPSIISLLCITKLLERAADLGGQIASSITSTEGQSLDLTGKNSVAGSLSNSIIKNTTHAAQSLLGLDKKSKARRAYGAKKEAEEKSAKSAKSANPPKPPKPVKGA
jgi:type IV secretory pathway VirB6-like protein